MEQCACRGAAHFNHQLLAGSGHSCAEQNIIRRISRMPMGRKREWKEKMQQRWGNMTPEEREKFKQEWGNRCGRRFGGRFEEEKRAEQQQ